MIEQILEGAKKAVGGFLESELGHKNFEVTQIALDLDDCVIIYRVKGEERERVKYVTNEMLLKFN